MESGTVIAILPCNDLDASERFYGRLGFTRNDRPAPGEPDTYRILSNGKGQLHLTDAVEGWLVPGRNPFGLYFYMEAVEVWATEFRVKWLGSGGRKTSRGACTSLQYLIQTKPWCGSVGRHIFANRHRPPRKMSDLSSLDSGAKCNRVMRTGFAHLCQAL